MQLVSLCLVVLFDGAAVTKIIIYNCWSTKPSGKKLLVEFYNDIYNG